jgi:hypothetical protein
MFENGPIQTGRCEKDNCLLMGAALLASLVEGWGALASLGQRLIMILIR